MQKVKFKDIIELKRGYDLPEHSRKDGIYPVFAANGICGYHSCFKSNGEGIITGRSGTIGKVMYSTSPFWPLNTTLYVSDFKGNSRRFIYYLLKSINLYKFATGAVVPTLNKNHLSDIYFHIPELSIQLRIANNITN